MSQFHETRMGMDHYLKDFPRLVKAAERIANALEAQNGGLTNGSNQTQCHKMKAHEFANAIESASAGRIVTIANENDVTFVNAETSANVTIEEIEIFIAVVVKNTVGYDKLPTVETVICKNNVIYILFHY